MKTILRNFTWLYVAIFVIGGVAGALLRPYVVPVRYEGVSVYPTQDGCDFHYSSEKYLFGSLLEMGDGGGKLACGEETDVTPTVSLTCRCRK